MASVVRMPSVLAGAQEAAISSWLVKLGDTVAVGDPLAEIETEKAVVEYGAEEAGVVGRIVLAAGSTGEIGVPIAVLVQEGETDADIDAALGGGAPAAPPPAPAPPPGASAPDPAAPATPDAVSPSAPATPAPATPAAATSAAAPSGPAGRAHPARRPYESEPPPAPAEIRVFASPIVRKIARAGGHRPGRDRGDRPERPDRPPRPRAARRPARGAAGRPGRCAARALAACPRPARCCPARCRPAGRGGHAHPAHADPAGHRAPPHREQDDDAALLHDHRVHR